MDDVLKNEEDSTVDFLNSPDNSIGQAGLNFSAQRQRDQFIGGSEVSRNQELERKTEAIYGRYFGRFWRPSLGISLLAEVRVATADDKRRVGSQVGWTETAKELLDIDNSLIKNHIVVHHLPSEAEADFPLRTEIGEAVYNLLDNTAVTGKVPAVGGLTPLVLTEGEATVARFCGSILDRWNAAYTQRPNRYTGLTGQPREYHNIPEWKSEGFSDAIAVEIRRRSQLPLSQNEAQIWATLTPDAKNVVALCADQFTPPVIARG